MTNILTNKFKHYIVGLSGGVDSAVAAYLLKKQGHKVTGVFMKNWEDDDDGDYCATREDFIAAVACADVIGMDIHHINFAREYKEKVFSYFLNELKLGRTPNPDILCNSEIKFNAFLKNAINLDADEVATGHYAKVIKNVANGKSGLFAASDVNKDQTYFLYRLSEKQLASAEFPLAQYTKAQVREIATTAGIPSANRKDSTGICFIGERDFAEFLKRYLPTNPGNIVDENNNIVGKHQGLAFYTIGQRQGLGIGGVKNSKNIKTQNLIHEPWFVAKKDITSNILIAVQGKEHPMLWQKEVVADNLHWLRGEPPKVGEEVLAKIRYRQKYAKGVIRSIAGDNINVLFDENQWAVTSGQSLVIYKHNSHQNEIECQIECLGGGIIK